MKWEIAFYWNISGQCWFAISLTSFQRVLMLVLFFFFSFVFSLPNCLDFPEMQEIVTNATELERYCCAPMCGSNWLDQETNDKILTR